MLMAIPTILATPPYGDPDQPYDRLPGTLETPHVKWAKPLAGGQLNVLFILPYNNSREVVETAQRLDLRYTVIMNAGHDVWAEGYAEGPTATPLKGVEAITTLEKIARQRLSLGHTYDVIVIGKVSWAVMPGFVRDLILKHVERGTGLVYVSPNRRQKGGEEAGEDSQFKKLFETNDGPDTYSLLDALPMDVLPIHVLEKHSEYKEVPGIPRHIYAQSSLVVTKSQHGKGRILSLDYLDENIANRGSNSLTPFYKRPDGKFDQVAYDYAFAILARGMLWSAKREPELRCTVKIRAPKTTLTPPLRKRSWKPEVPASVIARNDPTEASVSLSLKNEKKKPTRFKIVSRIRDRLGILMEEKRSSISLSARKPTAWIVPLPILKRGTYFIDFQCLNDSDEIIEFVSKSFRVETDQRVESLETDKDRYKNGEVIRGKVSFARPLQNDQQASVRAVDTWGRCVSISKVSLNDHRTGGTFELQVRQALTRVWDIQCEIRDERGPINVRTMWVTIPNWTFDDYLFMLIFSPTPGRSDWKGHLHAEVLKKYGINATFTYLIYSDLKQYEINDRYHLQSVSYAEHMGEINSPSDHHRDTRTEQPDLDLAEISRMARHIADTGEMLDPKKFPFKQAHFNAQWINSRIKSYQESARFGSPFYVLTGENYLMGEWDGQGNSGFGPTATKRFQEWCRKQFNNDLNALNAEWGSSLKSWNEVRGILIREADKKNQLPRWVDFRYFMRSRVWSQFFIDWTDMMRRFVPETLTGRVGHDHHDFSRYRKHMTASKVYFGQKENPEWHDAIIPELQQSFSGDRSYLLAPQSMIRWNHDLKTPLNRERWPWLILFLGMQGFDWERGLTAPSLGGEHCFTPDYSDPLPYFKDISKEVLAIQRGVGKLTIASRPHRSRVAMLWSPYNHYISRLNPLQESAFSGTWMYNVSVIGGAPSDCLALMNSLRIRPTIVAPEDILNRGLEQRGFRALLLPYNKGMSIAEAAAIREFVSRGGLVIADNTPGIFSEHGRELKTLRLPDLFPVTDRIHIVKHGRGRAAYLPNILNGYIARLEKCDYTGSDAVEALLKEYAEQEPPVELLNSHDMPRRDTLMRVFYRGTTTLISLLRTTTSEGKEEEETTVQLRKKQHIFDLRTNNYLGCGDSLEIRLDLHPKLLALLPARPLGMQITGQQKAVSGGTDFVIEGRVDFGKASGGSISSVGQAIHLRVYSPGGKELEWFRQNHLFDGRKFQVVLPVSYSAGPGRYRVVAEHVITGMKAEVSFDVVSESDQGR